MRAPKLTHVLLEQYTGSTQAHGYQEVTNERRQTNHPRVTFILFSLYLMRFHHHASYFLGVNYILITLTLTTILLYINVKFASIHFDILGKTVYHKNLFFQLFRSCSSYPHWLLIVILKYPYILYFINFVPNTSNFESILSISYILMIYNSSYQLNNNVT